MNQTPYVIAKCAISLDGYLDDAGPSRLILSGAEDFDRVDEVRASCDAILVGAGTVRADDPRLLIRSDQRRHQRIRRDLPPDPLKVTLTRSGRLRPDVQFFTAGDGTKVVYCSVAAADGLRATLCGRAEVVAIRDEDLVAVLADLARRGVGRLLVEGGREVLTAFLTAGLVDELQVSIAPFFVGDAKAPRFVQPGIYPHDKDARMRLKSVEQLGDVALLTYTLLRKDAHARWLRKAIELSRNCPPSQRAFSVGCVIVDGRGEVVATGYSREVNDHEHAEELALRRAEEAGTDLTGATLYSSLEPCSVRLSGRTSCTERILRSGISAVVFAMEEPAHFVDCEGAEKLREAGVSVVVLGEYAAQVAEVNGHLLGGVGGAGAAGPEGPA